MNGFFNDLYQAAQLILTWQSLAAIAFGIVVGHWVGAIPGLTSSMAIALLIPVTFYFPSWVAIAMLIGVFKGALFAASTSAILIRTPGMPSAAAVLLDGYPLTEQGKSGKALKLALVSAIIGDTFSDVVLILFTGTLAAIALKFGPPEYMAMMVFALTVVAGVAGKSLFKGIAAALFGLIIATVGTDAVTTTPRLTFGNQDLYDGFSLIPLLIGLLALSEIFLQFERSHGGGGERIRMKVTGDPADQKLSWPELRMCLPAIFRGAAIGTVIGAIPGLGATIASFLSYNEAQRHSKHPERFGKGALEGVAAADSAGSAVSGSNLVPLLAFGIPGDVVAAILLGAFMIHGITPGPLVFTENAPAIYAIYMGLMIGNLLNLVLGYGFIRMVVHVLEIPKRILFPIIVAMAVIGSYSLNGSFFDVEVMFAFGVVGYLMNRFGYSTVALLIGFILGPMLETNIRRSLILSGDDPWVFFTRPVSLAILALTVLVLFNILKVRKRQQKAQEALEALEQAEEEALPES